MRDPDLLAHLAGLPAGPAADAAAARAIAALEPAQAARALKVLVDSAKSSPEAGQVLSAASRALMFGSEADLPFAHRGRIHDAAAELGIPEVAALFVIDKPAKVLEPSAAEPPDAELAHLTLGHKKMLARKAEPDRMARLAVEGDGRVIRELLLNPKLTEGVVIRMAARRPAKVEALVEIWHSPKWSVRYSVRKALAMNPYTPPEISLKILPHLMRGDLKMISADRALHATVRELAQKLRGRRGA